MLWWLLLAGLLVVVNGFFVAAEFALVKVRSTQLDVEVARGSATAAQARGILNRLDAYLSACQVGITLASLGLGWVGEPVVAAALGPLLRWLEVDEDLGHRIALGVGFLAISFVHIVIGEQAPKNFAISRPLGVSMAVAWPLRVVYVLFWPALVLLNGASNVLLRAVGIPVSSEHEGAVPAEELRRITERSVAQGEITVGQGELLANVFRFTGHSVRHVMVPRNKVAAVNLGWPTRQIVDYVLENGQSRYPAYDEDLDGIVGILHVKDMMPHLRDGWTGGGLRELLRPPLFVPESLSVQRLLGAFQRARSHMAVALDEHGGVAGILTIEDALEELVGDIRDEHDVDERASVEATVQGWSFDGRATIAEVAEALGLADVATTATTLSGYVTERLGRLARVDDTVEIGPYVARVTSLAGRAIERVEVVTRSPSAPPVET